MTIESKLDKISSQLEGLTDILGGLSRGLTLGEPGAVKPGQPLEDQPSKDEVIAALKKLQDAKDAKAVKAALKKWDAATIGKLDPANYQDVIDHVEKVVS